MKRKQLRSKLVLGIAFSFLFTSSSFGQSNVFDDVISTSPNHTYLTAALQQEGLDVALQNSSATLTVFAPDNAAFDDLAAALGTDINGLLALTDLSDILQYHVLGQTVPASAVNNGDVVPALSMTNTLKLTKTSTGMVYANQAQVNGADLTADNGVVHSVDAVLLPYETVVDVAIDNGFTTLTAAVIQEELLPVLTNPLSKLTVFAPSNQAFDDLATALSTDVNGLLALTDLADILTYHVLDSEVNAADISNGDIVAPISTTNTLKMTVTSGGMVYANQAQVATPDLGVYNGVVHVLDAVVLPYETVVDVAIDNGFTTLTTAVIQEELLPALTNPLAELTVFAPTNQAFDDLATALSTDLNGILALPNLSDVLLYHVLGSEELSTDLVNGPVTTLNGSDVTVDITNGVMINSSTVTTPDLTVDNGTVHVIDAVLVPSTASIDEVANVEVSIYPNPSSDVVTIELEDNTFSSVALYSLNGQEVLSTTLSGNQTKLDVSGLEPGEYIMTLRGENAAVTKTLQLISASK